MRILRTFRETCADGPGIRYAIYVAGCDLGCEDCQNQDSWIFNQGELLTLNTLARIKHEIRTNPMISGITISGGDPLHIDNAHGTMILLESLLELKKHTMVFTGRTLEQILDKPWEIARIECLKYIDILVDGPFVKSLRDVSGFRGSTNQRFIKTKDMWSNGDLRKSMIKNYIVNDI